MAYCEETKLPLDTTAKVARCPSCNRRLKVIKVACDCCRPPLVHKCILSRHKPKTKKPRIWKRK